MLRFNVNAPSFAAASHGSAPPCGSVTHQPNTPPAGALALQQGLLDADQRVQAGVDVAQRHADASERLDAVAGCAADRDQPALGLHQQVVGLQAEQAAVLAVAKLFVQSRAKTLRKGAAYLPISERWVQNFSGIVPSDVVLDAHRSGGSGPVFLVAINR